MSHVNRTTTRLAVPFVLALCAGAALAGPLSPPAGPVSSTMKTMQEVEPRTPIGADTTPGDADSVFRITQAGSYYLTGNVTGQSGKSGIEVVADDVTIDLCGFVLEGVAGSKAGVTDTGLEEDPISNLTVRNGTIRGFGYGQISCEWVRTGRLEGLTVSGTSYGINFRGSGTIDGCTATGIGATGSIGFSVDAATTITRCLASGYDTGYLVLGATVQECVARGNKTGFSVASGIIRDCLADSNSVTGVQSNSSLVQDCRIDGCPTGIEATGFRDTIRGNAITSCSVDGIRVGLSNTKVIDNTIAGSQSDNQTGIRINQGVTRCYVEGNVGSYNAFGIVVDGTGNTIVGNIFGDSLPGHVNYQLNGGNRFGTIVHAATNASPVNSASSSPTVAGTLVTTDPFANISY